MISGYIGAGGMGEVYRARDPRLERDVALKMLPPAWASDATFVARFRREALTLAALNHPNIATILGIEERGGTAVLAMEYIDGETLAARLRRPLAFEEALGVCVQISEALEAAHRRGVIHRDLKPSNVMIGPQGLVKVLDFGLARHQQSAGDLGPAVAGLDGSEGASASAGTPGYMSPEQILGLPQDTSTDLFAFGCVLFECLTGKPAFENRSKDTALLATLHQEIDWARLPERTPSSLRAVLEGCLEKDAGKRIREARIVRATIEEVLGIGRASAIRRGEPVGGAPHNLTRPRTPFLGRGDEIRTCTRWLRNRSIVTLTGPGGSGKTCLALRVCESMLEEYGDGVWFVDLASLERGDRVPSAVAGVLGIRVGRATVEDQLVDQLVARPRTLVVFDNCEHVLQACASLVRHLVERCPGLAVLATSREPLGVDGERVVPLAPFSYPGEDVRTLAEIAGFDAVRLFVERAAAVRPGFALTENNAATVAEICRELDGLPLAIELAAARAQMLSPGEIAARLDDRFRLLTFGPRQTRGGHRTLLATIRWSYDLLTDDERRFARALSVFAGGWTLVAATAVCNEGDEFRTLDLLARLATKSLVVVAHSDSGDTRYHFLESIRRFALDQLAHDADEERGARGRHVEFFTELAIRAERAIHTDRAAAFWNQFDADHENLLLALATCARDATLSQTGLALAGSLSQFWATRGHLRVGRDACLTALEHADDEVQTRPRAWCLNGAGYLSYLLGDMAAAKQQYGAGLVASESVGSAASAGTAHNGLGIVAQATGDMDEARRQLELAVGLWRTDGNRQTVAVALQNLGAVLLFAGHYAEAAQTTQETIDVARELGDMPTQAIGLNNLAVAELRQDRLSRVAALIAESLGVIRTITARNLATFVLETAVELGERIHEYEPAAIMLGQAAGLREATGFKLTIAAEQAVYDKVEDGLRRALGDERFTASFQAGRESSFEDGLEQAIAILERWDHQLRP